MGDFDNYRNAQGTCTVYSKASCDGLIAKMQTQGLRQVFILPLSPMTFLVSQNLDREHTPARLEYIFQYRGHN